MTTIQNCFQIFSQRVVLLLWLPGPWLVQIIKLIFFIDIDNNGYLDAHDFYCLAVRTCVLEGKGECSSARLQKYQHVMLSLWEEIAQLADFDKVPDYVGYPYTLHLATQSFGRRGFKWTSVLARVDR